MNLVGIFYFRHFNADSVRDCDSFFSQEQNVAEKASMADLINGLFSL